MYLSSGTILKSGTYKIQRLIASDGLSCSYEAVHIMMNKKVTVYEYFPKGLCDRDINTHNVTAGSDNRKTIYDKFKLKFVKEARLLTQLSHPGIIKTTDFFEGNNTAYYVTDFIEGSSLSEIIRRKGRLSENETLEYIRQVSDALAYLHKHNYLHLDIKPGNILIDSSEKVYLINFITSQHYKEDTGEITTSVLGIKTIGYSSLEQEGNDTSHFRPATDIYSLGATLYKCLAGETPMRATERAQGGELQPLPSTVSEPTKKAIYAALELSYKKRPQTIQEFLLILDPNYSVNRENEDYIASSNVNAGIEDGPFANITTNKFSSENDHSNNSSNSTSQSVSGSASIEDGTKEQSLPKGTLLKEGTYKVIRLISSGSWGCTYEAAHVMLNKRVAIKELFPQFLCNREADSIDIEVGIKSQIHIFDKFKRKFVKEASALSKLSHPGIVKINDVFEENNTAFFVMDYIEGVTLDKIIDARGSLKENEAVGYIKQVCEALDYVHGHKRLHLDIKPNHIMIGSRGKAILLDFEVSKQYNEDYDENTSTLLAKTPGFAPLEQIVNDVRYFNPATDIYALGATLYKCLTGKVPLEAVSLAQGEELDPLPNYISVPTKKAISSAMEVSRKNRPQNIKEFLSILNQNSSTHGLDEEILDITDPPFLDELSTDPPYLLHERSIAKDSSLSSNNIPPTEKGHSINSTSPVEYSISKEGEANSHSLPKDVLLKGGTYKIIGLIHSDEFTLTYEATHLMLNKRVVIKEFFPKELCDRDIPNSFNVKIWIQRLNSIFDKLKFRFIQEASALSQLSHPSIVKVSDVFEENGSAYYVMDYISGSTLDDIVTRKGKLDEEEALNYIEQLSSALDYVHKNNCLHLDINPSNISIDRFNNAVLINFGSYKQYQPYYDVIDDDSGYPMVEPSSYEPIELSGGNGINLGPRTDIYALGATFYRCLTGKTPLSPHLQLIEEEKLEPLPSCVSEETKKAIKSAMELYPQNRPQTIGEFLSILNPNTSSINDTEETERDDYHHEFRGFKGEDSLNQQGQYPKEQKEPIKDSNSSSDFSNKNYDSSAHSPKSEEKEDESMLLKSGYLLQGGKYRIVRFIARGGFGCTYEAEHMLLAKKVAVKEFFPKKFCDRDMDTLKVSAGTESLKPLISKLKLKFMDEARSLARLSHPCIVKVNDIFEENGTAYYVMDYIEGSSLAKVIKDKGRLSEKETMGYIRQICDSLDYVHAQNCLHLDIKPGNIMIEGTGRAVLIDFGAAKQYDEENGENTSTLLGKTPGFAPIEQMGNDVRYFKPATDIYALGATIYKCLSGRTPLEVSRLVNGEELDPLPSNVTQSVKDAIDAAMEISSKKRPQTIKEFVAILDNDKENTKKNGKRSIWGKWFGKSDQ